MLINDLEDYFKRSANYSGKYSGIDHPSLRQFTKIWRTYPIQNFDYQFNSWGFRGPEYEQYVGKNVNICLGDSFTVNVGGPIEHSWTSKLAQKFDIPTLNLGVDGASNEVLKLVYDRACKIFNVQNTFAMHTFFHRRLAADKTFIQVGCIDLDENIVYFEENKITDSFYTFLPFWCYTNDEIEYIKTNHPNNYCDLTKLSPNKNGLVNRDNRHMNELCHDTVADFLWSLYAS